MVAKDFGIGKDTLNRYIRMTHLIPELLEMVDEDRIALTRAEELSYLNREEQQALLSEIEYANATPSHSQAQRLKVFSRQDRLNTDIVYVVINEEKADQKERVKISGDRIRKYFPNTTAQMEETIVKLCEAYHRKRLQDRDCR